MSRLHKLEDVVWVNTKQLKPHPKNTNRHSIEQIDRLAKILMYQGFRKPIVVSNQSGFIVTGHCTLDAALKNKWQTVPVSYQDFEDEAQEYAHMEADNEIARWAQLDKFQLFENVKEMNLPDLDMLGFQNDIFKNLNNSELDIMDVEDVETNYTFSIKCKTASQFQEVKKFFGTEGKAVDYFKIKELLS